MSFIKKGDDQPIIVEGRCCTCGNPASNFVEGKLYCKEHSPEDAIKLENDNK